MRHRLPSSMAAPPRHKHHHILGIEQTSVRLGLLSTLALRMSLESNLQKGSPRSSQSGAKGADTNAISDQANSTQALPTAIKQDCVEDEIGHSERQDTDEDDDKRYSSPVVSESELSKTGMTVNDTRTQNDEAEAAADVAPYKDGESIDDATEIGTNESEPIQSLHPNFLTTAHFLNIQQGEDVRGVQDLVKEVESFDPEKNDLKRKKHDIIKQLKDIRKRQRVAEDKVKEAERSLQAERIAAGISDNLWLEYQNFCAAPFLQPESEAEPVVLNFTYNKEFEDLYIKYDPRFRAFKERGLLVKGENWRCNRTTLYSKGGTPFAYHVEFRQLHPGSLDGKTSWAERFVSSIDTIFNIVSS